MNRDDLSEIERAIAAASLPPTRHSFDQSILSTIESIGAIQSCDSSNRLSRPKRNWLSVLPLLVVTSVLAFSAGRLTSLQSSAIEKTTSTTVPVATSIVQPLSEPLLNNLVQNSSVKDTVWGLVDQAEHVQFKSSSK